MKRVNHIFPLFVDFENLKRAHLESSKGKHHYRAVAKFEENKDANLAELQTELLFGTYTTGKYRTKTIEERGKQRLIYILPYRDRVVQRALGFVVEPVVMRHLTADTHATIKDRGIHSALRQVCRYLNSDPAGTAYCLKIDVHHYFPSIDHDIIKGQFRRLIKDKRILRIIDNIIDSVPPDEGLPIGNYFSQLAANLYLSDFDHFVKEYLKVRYYIRYMDDMVFFASSAAELRRVFRQADWYLTSRLHLSIKDNWQIFPLKARPLDFVGYRTTPGNVILRKSTFKRLRRRCLDVRKHCKYGEDLTYNQYCSVNSFKGWSMWGNDSTIRRKYYQPIQPVLSEFHKIQAERRVKG
ncbi:reverse transcriptase/maturase family protein [Methanocorpusculum vombati]|uniref:Reverse transcriptase/maturase family protein n=1 Tax=Methanocorpusculum vombati TaxID=3002864 RepID=A0ABT4IME9_9EURY|nr:reverse transcriptase/maturase family protein [Methanocorpusculum vombati]MCZ9319558.1 reverse transcriptase/maturase family protein [Methanocorpusculum sp.]MCZ0862248.1 reverse transcriptase/maturase family protein [Methanocorpusculum vombati]MDE2519726.1 reverse transcriptase/maturase family protein [Methanocorpusculum sp.]MDE2534492.1 reverse transcriptase/maturase family protein [Methanocorpusculum sp.]MDE2546738.1 reverse transcriptase/maturase family protein [Methanocorpusculum sp.]